jgi:hypothetical protein
MGPTVKTDHKKMYQLHLATKFSRKITRQFDKKQATNVIKFLKQFLPHRIISQKCGVSVNQVSKIKSMYEL